MARNTIAKLTSVQKAFELGNVVTLTWSDETNTELRLSGFPENIQTQFGILGMTNKVRDSYAGISDVAEAKTKANEVIEHLMAGEWAVRKVGEAKETSAVLLSKAAFIAFGGKPDLTDTVSVEGADMDIKTLTTLIESFDTKTRRTLKKVPEVQKALADLSSDSKLTLAGVMGSATKAEPKPKPKPKP